MTLNRAQAMEKPGSSHSGIGNNDQLLGIIAQADVATVWDSQVRPESRGAHLGIGWLCRRAKGG
jgi:hypothetical protein